MDKKLHLLTTMVCSYLFVHLTYHQWAPVTITKGQFHNRYLSHRLLNIDWKVLFWNFIQISQWADARKMLTTERVACQLINQIPSCWTTTININVVRFVDITRMHIPYKSNVGKDVIHDLNDWYFKYYIIPPIALKYKFGMESHKACQNAMANNFWLNISLNYIFPCPREPINSMTSSKAIYWYMMTSSNANIFRVTGHLCGEFTGQRWIPRTKASDAELWYFSFICVWINGWVNNGEAGDLRLYRVHCDVIVMRNSQNYVCGKMEYSGTWQN